MSLKCNDDDKASVHASSGLTRKFQPKPSFWAVKHLYETLGEFRLNRIVLKKKDDVYAYEFMHKSKRQLVWAVWSPTGSDREELVTLRNLPGKLFKAERMLLKDGVAEKVDCQRVGAMAMKLIVSESPVYLTFEPRK